MIDIDNRNVGFKKTKLGWIPKDWEVVKTDVFVELLSGYAFKSKNYLDNCDGLKLLRGDNIMQGFFRWSGAKYWSKENTDDLLKYFLKENDLVIAMDRTWVSKGLKVAVLSKNDLPCLLVQRVSRLRVKAGLKQELLPYFFSSHRFEQYVKGVQKESAVPHISSKQIKDYLIPYPPLPEQQKIATILSTWDTAIEKMGQLIEAKEEQKKGLTQRLLTGKVRFQEFVKSKKSFKTKFGNYPEDWNYPKIGEIAKGVVVKNTNGADLPVLSCTKHYGLVDSLKYFGKQIYSKDTSPYKVVSRGQFAYATNHIEEGSIGYQDLYEKALISPMYTAFETNERVNDYFLFKVLKTPLYIHIYQANTSASVDRRGSLRWKSFSLIHIPLPTLEEQNKIALVIKESENEIKLLQNKMDALKEQKKGLMQRLLTGKIRVKI